MWSHSLPPEKQPSYFSEQFAHIVDWLPRHKYVVIGAALSILLVASIAFIVFQNSASSRQQDTVSVGASSTTVSTNQAVLAPEVPAVSAPAPEQASVNNAGTTTQLKVNNQTIPVPKNGSVQKTIPGDSGSANIDISVNSSSTSSNTSSSSTSINVNTNSQSEVVVENSE